tara:strand:- start:498 stop:1406 length:909 start_codon:yes stop_codon:yes gene_type:complete
MADTVQNVLKESETILNRALDNPYINITIKILLGLYAALAAPKLPQSLSNLVDNTFVRIAFAFLIVYMATRDPSIAILIAIGFIITLQTANKMRLYNTDLSVSNEGETSWLPSAKEIQGTDSEENEPELVDDASPFKPVTELVSNVVDTAGNLVNDVAYTGQNLVSGVANTGQNLVSGVANTGSNFVSNVADVGETIFSSKSVDDKHTASESIPSDSLNDVVEGLQGIMPSNLGGVASINGESPTLTADAFTTASQFDAAQSNQVPGSNQYSCTRTWNNQHCIQGLETNAPNGDGDYGYSKF